MSLVINFSIFVTILSIIALTYGFILTYCENISPKRKAILGSFLTVLMGTYIILLSIISINGFIKLDILKSSLVIFVIIPFIIGYFSKYDNLKYYTTLQIFSYIFSLVILVNL